MRRGEIRLVDIALLPEHRGRGIGGALLRGLLDEGAVSGRRVSMHVERSNPALRLYERLGFERVKDDGIYWLMEWSLPGDEGDATGLGRRSR
jgi:ribosomal protein S18 acetylase RimI-like enzyme